jgi:serine/threonine protein kinase
MSKSKINNPKRIQRVVDEINIMFTISSNHVVRLFNATTTENNYYLLLELCNGSDLETLRVARGGYFEESEAIILLN